MSDDDSCSDESNDSISLESNLVNTNLYNQQEAFNCFKTIDCDKIRHLLENSHFELISIDEIYGCKIKYCDDKINNFVATDEAKIRISKILLAAKAGVFLLITGTTSSAKTYSVMVASNIYNQLMKQLAKNQKKKKKIQRY